MSHETSTDPPNTDRDALLWLATRYHLGELPADEAAAFESRLLDDLVACEALGQAVELTLAVRLAEAEIEVETLQPLVADGATVVPGGRGERETQPAWMRPVGWLSLGAAACLALLLSWQNLLMGPSQLAAEHETSLAVATAWAEVAAAHDFGDHGLELDSLAGELSLLAASETNGGESLESDSTDEHAQTPSWLLTALEAR